MATHHGSSDEVGALATAVRVADEVAHAMDHPDEGAGDTSPVGVPSRAAAAMNDLGIDEQHHEKVLADVEKRYDWVQGVMAG
jgi:hypothetical protein